jgi:hypothetical protein
MLANPSAVHLHPDRAAGACRLKKELSVNLQVLSLEPAAKYPLKITENPCPVQHVPVSIKFLKLFF